jgi:hypothetical protein
VNDDDLRLVEREAILVDKNERRLGDRRTTRTTSSARRLYLRLRFRSRGDWLLGFFRLSVGFRGRKGGEDFGGGGGGVGFFPFASEGESCTRPESVLSGAESRVLRVEESRADEVVELGIDCKKEG